MHFAPASRAACVGSPALHVMRLAAGLLLLAVALPPSGAEPCSFPCSHGTCNEAERRCDCPPGVGGSACDVVATPSCVLEPGEKLATSAQAPPWESRSCACMTEWLQLINTSATPVAWSPEHSPGTVQCYDTVPGVALHTLWALAEAGAVNTSLLTISREPHAPEGRLTWSLAPLPEGKREEWEREPLGNCAYNCSLHGMCSRHDGGTLSSRLRVLGNGTEEPPRCVCWGDRLGEGCERNHPAAPEDGSAYCLNRCRRVGTCIRGTCVCPPGTWGADCSVSRAPDGSLRLLRGFGPEYHIASWVRLLRSSPLLLSLTPLSPRPAWDAGLRLRPASVHGVLAALARAPGPVI
jgi:hypothetical protein